VAERHFDATRFEEFCARHLPHLNEVAWEFFGTDAAREAVRVKVQALYPAHEVEQFTELFWSRIQRWREEGSPTAEAAPSPARSAGAADGTDGEGPPAAPAAAPAPARRPARRRPTRTA
jgi:hypothetical protein